MGAEERDAKELAALVAMTDKLLGILGEHTRALALLIESHEQQRAKEPPAPPLRRNLTSWWVGQLPPSSRPH